MRSCVLIVYLYVNVGLLCAQVPDSSIKLLYKHLFLDNNYNNKIRPQVNWTQTTVVNTSFTVVSLIDYNEVAEMLSLTGKLTIEWIDEYLTWDPDLFGGLTRLDLPQNEIWKPDLALENSVTSYIDLGTSAMVVSIDFDGHVTWKPMQAFYSACIADVKKFPLDEQSCSLKFEAWSHSVEAVQLNMKYDYVRLHGFSGVPEWDIVKTKAEILLEFGDRYAGFHINLKRKPTYIFLNVILPIAAISFLGQCVFLLPLESGEKASFSVTVLLSLAVFLTIVSQQLPNTSDNVSVFNVFVFTQVVICTLSTIITLLQLRFFYMDDTATVPMPIRKLVSVRILACRKKQNLVQSKSVIEKKKEAHLETNESKKTVLSITELNLTHDLNVDSAEGQETDSYSPDITWKLVARWIDLSAFWTFLILNICLIICITLI